MIRTATVRERTIAGFSPRLMGRFLTGAVRIGRFLTGAVRMGAGLAIQTATVRERPIRACLVKGRWPTS